MKYEKIRLSEITENLDGKRKPLNHKERNLLKYDPRYAYYGANGLLDYIDKYIFNEEILCVAEDGGRWGLNEVCSYIINEPCWINNHAHVLRMKKNIDIKFLYYYLNYKDLNKYITGTTRGKLTKTALNSIEIKLPDIEMQKQIVNVLDRSKSLISKRKQQIEALDHLAESVFLDMFGDPVKNEKGWKIKSLSKTGELKRGKSKHRPRNAPELLNGPYPLIQTGDIARAGLYIKKYNQTYSELGLKQSKLWPKGTLCITIAANIADTSILSFDACFPDSVVAFLPNQSVNNVYVRYWFTFLQRIIEGSAPESAQKNINLKILSQLKISIPPIELQNKFLKIIDKIDKQRKEFEKGLTELENLFNSLMQQAFKGEIFKEKEEEKQKA